MRIGTWLLPLTLTWAPLAAAQLDLTLNSTVDISALGHVASGGGAFDPTTGHFWLSDAATTNTVYEIDPLTGALFSSFNANVIPGMNSGPDGVALDPVSGNLFLFSPFAEDAGGVVTKSGSLVTNFGASGDAGAAGFSAAGQLYIFADPGAAGGDGKLHEIDKMTGAYLTSVTVAGLASRIGSIDFDPFTGNAFLFNTDQQRLLEVDVLTGAVLSTTDMTPFGTPTSFATAFAFNADGSQLYLTRGVLSGHTTLYVFDRKAGPWTDVGCELAGTAGPPDLDATGSLLFGSTNVIALSNAAPSAPCLLVASLASTPTPFLGGTLKPFPPVITLNLSTGPAGSIVLPFVMPAGVPTGTQLYVQYAIQDAGGPQGASLSNAVLGTTP